MKGEVNKFPNNIDLENIFQKRFIKKKLTFFYSFIFIFYESGIKTFIK